MYSEEQTYDRSQPSPNQDLAEVLDFLTMDERHRYFINVLYHYFTGVGNVY